MRSALALLFVSCLAAQTATVPNGTGALEQGANNTIPFWNVSNTYQQIHDAADVAAAFGSPTATITSITFRKDGLLTGGVAGRALDVQISLGTTSIPPSQVTQTFATNIGGAPVIVLPYTTLNLPSLTNSGFPNPPGWPFPFTTPFAYDSNAGHLCWEMRHLNSVNTTAGLDAWSPTNPTVYPSIGLGCIATGQTLPALIATRSLDMSSGDYRNLLQRAAASTPAVFFIGLARTTISLPGLCTSLEFLPVADVAGGTDALGTWDLTLTFGSLVGRGAATIYGQFVFLDAGLPPWGLGLSNASRIGTPPGNFGLAARVWAASLGAGPGFETATMGNIGFSFGLVTTFN